MTNAPNDIFQCPCELGQPLPDVKLDEGWRVPGRHARRIAVQLQQLQLLKLDGHSEEVQPGPNPGVQKPGGAPIQRKHRFLRQQPHLPSRVAEGRKPQLH